MSRRLLTAAALAAFPLAASAQTVTVSLTSPQDGQLVAPGAAIDWQISFSVSTGDNEGLALLITDLRQDPDNPGLLDIPPADGVPAAMSNFSRPSGISNPGEQDPITGYIGVQRGTAGQMNLIQIGGGQNNFGAAQPPGSGIAENANLVSGIGQSGAVVLATGSFTAPSACGTYTFSLANTLANVLLEVNAPPAFSPATEAAVVTAPGSFTFTVGLVGDTDGDGDIDLADLSALLTVFGLCSGQPGYDPSLDFNASGCIDLPDLSALLTNFGLSGC